MGFCRTMDPNNPYSTDAQQLVSNPVEFDRSTVQIADPIQMEIADDDLVDIVNKRLKASQKFFEENYNLKARRKKNETFLFGRQLQERIDKKELKDYETRSSDNALYEIAGSKKALATSKIPDIIITPGGEDPQRKQSAKDLTAVIDDVNKSRHIREQVALAYKHLPANFIGILKARWDSKSGKDGDSTFDAIHPHYIVFDHTATNRDVNQMSFIGHWQPYTIQELLMQFPKKKDDLYRELQKNGIMVGSTPTWTDMGSEINVWEIWFDWYKKKGTKELMSKQEAMNLDPEAAWEKVAGVLWKYEDVILDKRLDPNFDQKGEQKLFTYAVPGDETTKQEIDPQQLLMTLLQGQPMPQVRQETIYHNYFLTPQKPFFFMGYEQWGKTSLDETSWLEQNIRNQENLDDQNKTILDQLKTRIKHIWSRDSSLTKEDVQQLDMDAPRMDAMVDGSPRDVHEAIQPERPDVAQFNALSGTRSRMYDIAHAQAIRGNLQGQVATNNQIAREGDFTVSDDEVENTINPAYEWISQWQMQYIKLRYTQEHIREILGPAGDATYKRIRRDTPLDGMEVKIKTSSTDKLKAQRNAIEMAKLGPPYSNPLDTFRDMDMDDVEGRTERGIMFAQDPAGYFTKYVLHLEGPAAQAAALNGAAGKVQPPGGPSQPNQPPQPAAQAMASTNPQNPSPNNTSAVPTSPPELPQGSPRAL